MKMYLNSGCAKAPAAAVELIKWCETFLLLSHKSRWWYWGNFSTVVCCLNWAQMHGPVCVLTTVTDQHCRLVSDELFSFQSNFCMLTDCFIFWHVVTRGSVLVLSYPPHYLCYFQVLHNTAFSFTPGSLTTGMSDRTGLWMLYNM